MSMNFLNGVRPPAAGVRVPQLGESSESSWSCGGAGQVMVALTSVMGGLASGKTDASFTDTI